LFSYLKGKKEAFAIELIKIKPIKGGIDPGLIFGPDFCPPQSFRYLTDEERAKLSKFINAK